MRRNTRDKKSRTKSDKRTTMPDEVILGPRSKSSLQAKWFTKTTAANPSARLIEDRRRQFCICAQVRRRKPSHHCRNSKKDVPKTNNPLNPMIKLMLPICRPSTLRARKQNPTKRAEKLLFWKTTKRRKYRQWKNIPIDVRRNPGSAYGEANPCSPFFHNQKKRICICQQENTNWCSHSSHPFERCVEHQTRTDRLKRA